MKQLFILSLLFLQTSIFAFETEYGLASIYSDEYQNIGTASGEFYNPDDMTAAHPNLAFGTVVQVTNIKNGRKVNVRINDRGPFIKGYIIEISGEAASMLKLKGKASKVKVKIIQEAPDTYQPIIDEKELVETKIDSSSTKMTKEPEEEVIVTETTSTSDISASTGIFSEINEKKYLPKSLYKVSINPSIYKGYGIQVGIYSNLFNALRKAAMLQENWGSDILLVRKMKNGKAIYVVLIGAFIEKNDANEYKENAMANGVEGFVVTVPYSNSENYKLQSLRSSKKGFAVRLKDFMEEENVFSEVENLRKKWFKNIMINVTDINADKSGYQLLLGPFDSESAATSYKDNLKKKKIYGDVAKLD